MDQEFFKELHEEGLISDESLFKIEQKQLNPLFSIFWEVRTLIFVGIALLASGLGILVYENIDTIGQEAVLVFIALVCIGSFGWCFKHKKPFSIYKVAPPNVFFDYVVLLGIVSLLTFTGYLQYQYHVFGDHYGMATFVPMLILFYIAYDFDHTGILNIAIVNLALWMGISVTPSDLLLNYTFDSLTIIFTYLALGMILLTAGWLSGKYNFKAHFKFSYQHYGVHISCIALLAGYYNNAADTPFLWMLGLFILSAFIFYDSFRQKNYYFIVTVMLYSYLGLSSLVVRLLYTTDESGFYLGMLYFIFSAGGLIFLLIDINRKLKAV